MKDISIKGIVIAIVVAVTLDIISGIASVALFAENMSEEAMSALVKQSNFFIFAIFASAASSVIGGYICAYFGKLAPYKNAAVFGGIGVAVGVAFAEFDPIWFDVVGFITTIPAALFGAYIYAKKNA